MGFGETCKQMQRHLQEDAEKQHNSEQYWWLLNHYTLKSIWSKPDPSILLEIGENITNNYSLYHKKCRAKYLAFRHVNQIRWIWPYASISALSFTMKQASLYNYKEKNKNLSSQSNHLVLISLLDFSLRFLLIGFLISSNFFHDFGTHMTQMQWKLLQVLPCPHISLPALHKVYIATLKK